MNSSKTKSLEINVNEPSSAIINSNEMKIIARIHNDFPTKFGIPHQSNRLEVDFPEELLAQIPEGQREALMEVLANDPRPRYQKNPERIYGIAYGKKDIHFRIDGKKLQVTSVDTFFR